MPFAQRLQGEAVGIELSVRERFFQRRARALELASLEIRNARNRFKHDPAFGVLLDVAEEPMFARLRERDRDAIPAGAAGAPDAMDVGIG